AGLIYDKVTAPAVQLVNYTSVTGAGAAAIPLFGTPGASDDTSVWAVGALYDFGVAKASLAYSSLTDKFVAGGNDLTSKGYNLSVSVPFGATSVYGNLGRADVVQTGGIDAVLTGFQLGANYSLSKRTTAYAVYGSDTLTQAGVTGEAKRAQTSVGIRHTF
ncbi:MAG: porin, partial [Pseudomonadota bacterium]